MPPATHELTFSGQILQRGFWLYIWEIRTCDGETLYYVGRTGDSSSTNAQSPFNRMGQHLGFNDKSNVLRRRLSRSGVVPDACKFHLVAYGPILPEVQSGEEHRRSRDVVAALEKGLADAMRAAGYHVLNDVTCRKPLDSELFAAVCAAFRIYYPQLG